MALARFLKPFSCNGGSPSSKPLLGRPGDFLKSPPGRRQYSIMITTDHAAEKGKSCLFIGISCLLRFLKKSYFSLNPNPS